MDQPSLMVPLRKNDDGSDCFEVNHGFDEPIRNEDSEDPRLLISIAGDSMQNGQGHLRETKFYEIGGYFGGGGPVVPRTTNWVLNVVVFGDEPFWT